MRVVGPWRVLGTTATATATLAVMPEIDRER